MEARRPQRIPKSEFIIVTPGNPRRIDSPAPAGYTSQLPRIREEAKQISRDNADAYMEAMKYECRPKK